MFKFGHKSQQRLETVDFRLQKIAARALAISKVDFGIPEYGGKRTSADQQRLYQQGKSQLDGINKTSYHQTGLALDVYAFIDGKASWDKHHLAMIATAMLQAAAEFGYQLTWGGLWKNFEDYPHFQLEE